MSQAATYEDRFNPDNAVKACRTAKAADYIERLGLVTDNDLRKGSGAIPVFRSHDIVHEFYEKTNLKVAEIASNKSTDDLQRALGYAFWREETAKPFLDEYGDKIWGADRRHLRADESKLYPKQLYITEDADKIELWIICWIGQRAFGKIKRDAKEPTAMKRTTVPTRTPGSSASKVFNRNSRNFDLSPEPSLPSPNTTPTARNGNNNKRPYNRKKIDTSRANDQSEVSDSGTLFVTPSPRAARRPPQTATIGRMTPEDTPRAQRSEGNPRTSTMDDDTDIYAPPIPRDVDLDSSSDYNPGAAVSRLAKRKRMGVHNSPNKTLRSQHPGRLVTSPLPRPRPLCEEDFQSISDSSPESIIAVSSLMPTVSTQGTVTSPEPTTAVNAEGRVSNTTSNLKSPAANTAMDHEEPSSSTAITHQVPSSSALTTNSEHATKSVKTPPPTTTNSTVTSNQNVPKSPWNDGSNAASRPNVAGSNVEVAVMYPKTSTTSKPADVTTSPGYVTPPISTTPPSTTPPSTTPPSTTPPSTTTRSTTPPARVILPARASLPRNATFPSPLPPPSNEESRPHNHVSPSTINPPQPLGVLPVRQPPSPSLPSDITIKAARAHLMLFLVDLGEDQQHSTTNCIHLSTLVSLLHAHDAPFPPEHYPAPSIAALDKFRRTLALFADFQRATGYFGTRAGWLEHRDGLSAAEQRAGKSAMARFRVALADSVALLPPAAGDDDVRGFSEALEDALIKLSASEEFHRKGEFVEDLTALYGRLLTWLA
ncbi:hypothetical protein BU24DRAFT_458848 [Aaosphaeria arxii CBS 175.79]|uniref:Uncharacterized protein n=1 Tax=Aaosphaeria arxii CBS 175.79 TaxID=1450172 RepID=A0A6A5Y0S1_9PLEO|nr:uncharacterized protein BU24DRAFT_458848 [Aaosphaeria arxii CBS 175.79]KAF2019145.1 hypothetical protein BU24DRAFT_458848 [Aaosphaeria arxii CBS 175.79]